MENKFWHANHVLNSPSLMICLSYALTHKKEFSLRAVPKYTSKAWGQQEFGILTQSRCCILSIYPWLKIQFNQQGLFP